MKKIFTLLTMALLAVGASAQTATDLYLDIAQYETLDDIDLKNCTKLYSYNETKKVLVVSAYAVQQSSVSNQDEGKIGLGWFSCSASNSAGTSWDATGDFKGSAFYGTFSSGSASERGLNAKNHYSFFVTNCTKVSALIHSKSKSRTVTMDVYPVTIAANGDVTRGTKAGTASDNTNSVTTVTVDGLDASTIYEVEFYSSDNNGGHLYEVAFYQPNDEQPQAVEPVFLLTKSELYPGEESQIHIEGSEGLEGMIMRNIYYDDEIITVTGDGGIIAKKPGTTTIKFTTDAVEGKYLEGSAKLEITVKDYPEEIDYPTSTDGVIVSGTTAVATVKIHENTDEVKCIQLKSGYTSDGVVNGNYIKLVKKDGFKAGDVVTIAGVINNNDASKRATAELFAIDEDNKAIKINTFKDFINSYSATGDPEDQEYVLEGKYDVLYLGRNGGTTASLTKIKVVSAPPAEPHDPVAWDFTQALSDDDVANLKADDNWEYDEENGRYSYVPTFTSEEAKANKIQLTANNEILEVLSGLYFGRDGSIDSKKFGIDLGKGLNLAGGKYRVILSDLAKDDEVRVRITGSGEGARSVSLTNVAAGSGLEAPRRAQDANSVTSTDKEVAVGVFTVAADGIVVIETDAALLINAIAINTALPEYTPTGISVINAETESAADAPVYNLSGQRVNENYRGVVIKNGKKMIK